MFRTFVISGVILGVKNDAELKNVNCRRVSQRLEVVSGNFNVNGVLFRKIFVFPA